MLPTVTRFPTAITRSPDKAIEPRLVGDLAEWLIITAELLTFGILLLCDAFVRSFDAALFDACPRTLDLNTVAVNTVLF